MSVEQTPAAAGGLGGMGDRATSISEQVWSRLLADRDKNSPVAAQEHGVENIPTPMQSRRVPGHQH